MSLFVLDTDHISLFQRGHPLVAQRINKVISDELAVTIVSVEEQMQGWLKVIKDASGSPTLIQAYSRLHAALQFFSGINILDLDIAAYDHYEQLRRKKIRIGTQDLRIAAVVLSLDGILITRNQRDFIQVPGLVTQDWSQ
jgi:tRNA(fMet)-specific endonuclease VapC